MIGEGLIGRSLNNPPKGEKAIRWCKTTWCYCDGICEGCSNGYYLSTTGTSTDYNNGENNYTTHT